MNPETWANRRRLRALARWMLLGGFGLFVFSIFFYSAVFFFPGNGIAIHSGRLSIITSNDTTGGMPVGLSCDRTTPVVLFKPLFVFANQSTFIAVPLWVIGIPAALLLLADGWLVVRARQGRCFACGYSLRGLPTGAPCPECGLAATQSRPPTRPEMARALARAVGRRSLAGLAICGVLLSIAWFSSPFYLLRYNHTSRHSVTIVHGRLEIRWYRPVIALTGADMQEEKRRAAEIATFATPSVPTNLARRFTPGLLCTPTDTMGLSLGWLIPPAHDGRLRTLILPLWLIVPPLLSCAIPLFRRPRANQSSTPAVDAPAPAVPSQRETP